MKQILSLFLAISVAVTSVSPCFAQVAAQTGQGMKAVRTAADCSEQGRDAGNLHSTGGAFTVGVASGVLLGLIGTGGAWLFQGTPEPSSEALQGLDNAECRQAFREAYGQTAKRKKRGAALKGGLLGTAVAVVLILSSSSSN